ncbi:uncharacterized protein [Nicotiana tomentosiformis]|uniref:uncharacterized protein n=1 Tax=Nicotiana tomentosiformis TaxID=4098 RepID=UPI00388C6C20
MTSAIPRFPRLEWRGSFGHNPSRMISFLKAQRMVEKGCLAYLDFVRDVSAAIPTNELVPVVRVFIDVFPTNLLGMPRDRDIDFGIDPDLNLSQWRWLKLLKNYNTTILYHPGKANVVADALSRKAESIESLAFIPGIERCLAINVQTLANRMHGGAKEVIIGDDGVLQFHSRISDPNVDGLSELILEEAHSSRYTIHSGVTKMYRDLKLHYWWRRMKKGSFLARFTMFELSASQIKDERVGECCFTLKSRKLSCFAYQCNSNVLTSLLPKACISRCRRGFVQAQFRKKSYVDRKVHDMDFMEGEKVLLTVSPIKGMMRLGKGQVEPKQYHEDQSHMLDFISVQLDENLAYEEELMAILDRQVKLRSKDIAPVKF